MVAILGVVAGLYLASAIVRAVAPAPILSVEEQARLVRIRMAGPDYRSCGDYRK
jgi:hypothetical protein